MPFTIAFSGKGGTGKTTLSSLCIKYLLKNKLGPILAVDADPNSNLNDCLGIKVNTTVAEIREDTLGSGKDYPAGMTKPEFIQYEINRTLIESSGFDLLSMGRPEGPGCYCYANNLIKKFIEHLTEEYRFVVVDTEAGMEHFSRRTVHKIDLLVFVSDYSLRGITAAARIKDLSNQLKLQVEQNCLILNRAPKDLDPSISQEIEKNKLQLGGIIPPDEKVTDFDIKGTPLIELPEDSQCYQALEEILSGFISNNKDVN